LFIGFTILHIGKTSKCGESKYTLQSSIQPEFFLQILMLLVLQRLSMSRPDRLKRQPTANTTPQSTPSFDPIDLEVKEEASQRTDNRKEEEITGAVEEKREGRQKSSGGRNPSTTQK
jgi:hypothetical protein